MINFGWKIFSLSIKFLISALRLTLVSRTNNYEDAQNLANALFGILMLLPQTDAFNMLKNRLQCVTSYAGVQRTK